MFSLSEMYTCAEVCSMMIGLVILIMVWMQSQNMGQNAYIAVGCLFLFGGLAEYRLRLPSVKAAAAATAATPAAPAAPQ